MHHRYFFVLFLFSYAELLFAEDGTWDCGKGNDGEWFCLGQKQVGEPDEPKQREGEIDAARAEEPKPAKLIAPTPIKLPAPIIAKPSKPVTIQPPKTVTKQPGWTCKASDEDETWNCSLIGADPKGKNQVTGDTEDSSGFLTATFDYKQEQIFDALHSQLKYDPWENCSRPSLGNNSHSLDNNLRNTAPMDVTADYSEVFDKDVTSFFC